MNSRQSIEPVSRFRFGLAIGLSVFSALLFLGIGTWTWFLRDGLGPDSIESFGAEALRRFITDFWPVAAFCLFLLVVAYFVAPRHTFMAKPVNP